MSKMRKAIFKKKKKRRRKRTEIPINSHLIEWHHTNHCEMVSLNK